MQQGTVKGGSAVAVGAFAVSAGAAGAAATELEHEARDDATSTTTSTTGNWGATGLGLIPAGNPSAATEWQGDEEDGAAWSEFEDWLLQDTYARCPVVSPARVLGQHGAVERALMGTYMQVRIYDLCGRFVTEHWVCALLLRCRVTRADLAFGNASSRQQANLSCISIGLSRLDDVLSRK